MGIATGNPTWEDFPSTNTPITADSLNRIETAIDGKQDAGSYAAATHTHTMADLTDYTPPDPGGLKVYTSWAEVDAETEPTTGVLTTTDWAPAGLTYGSDGDVTRDAAFFITTQVATLGTPDGAWARRRQELRMWDESTGLVWRVREFPPGGPWWEWWDVEHRDLPNALRDSLAPAENSVVDLNSYPAYFDDPGAPYTVGSYNREWRWITGFAELPDDYTVANVFCGGSYGGPWTQRVVVPLPDGTSRTISRVSTDGTSYGAWTLQPLGFSGAYADLTGAPTIPDSPDDIGAAPATQPINAQTGAYTLTASDAGKLVTVTATAAADVTVPAGVFTAGQRVDVLDLGAERITFVAGSGMSLGGTPSLVSRDQYSAHSIIFLSATEAVVVGDLA